MADKTRSKSDGKGGGGSGGGLSFRSDDAIDTGLLSSGPATIKEALPAMYDYGGNAKPVPVILLTFARDGEQDYEQPYSVGKGWKIANSMLVPTQGQTGLPKTCNAMRHLIRPLERALEASDAPADVMDGFPACLEGLDVTVTRVEQEKRNIRDDKGGKAGKPRDDGKERTILEIEAITGAPWIEGGGKGGKKKAAAAAASKAADKGADKTTAKGKGRDDDDQDEDEDEDEKPTKGRGGKSDKSKGKDDDDDSANDELLEEGVEAMISALEANDGTLHEDDLEDALAKVLRKHPKAKAIIAYMTDADVLELEKGWSYNSKKHMIAAD